jgi:hypothetical protein
LQGFKLEVYVHIYLPGQGIGEDKGCPKNKALNPSGGILDVLEGWNHHFDLPPLDYVLCVNRENLLLMSGSIGKLILCVKQCSTMEPECPVKAHRNKRLEVLD